MRLPLRLPCLLLLGPLACPAAPKLELAPAERLAEAVVDPASGEALRALDHFEVPEGFAASLWAAEPMLANPVAISFDERGRLFVAETHRYRTSVLDIRDYMGMLERDLASRTVEDRALLIDGVFGDAAAQLAVESERVSLIEDTDGDGVADTSHVFATGFNSALDGIASGVLPHDGEVWFANIPSLWKLTPDASGNKAANREELLRGFGVHFGFTGHDLHGLIVGPDGKLYFSIGDRGAHVTDKSGSVIAVPDTGAVFRCNPDGSKLEVVATGLRNPQELAFDDWGNLFTGDNDCDNGDLERFVHVVEGSDSGWRIGYQFAPLGRAGPWMTDGLWKPRFEGQPAYILPPICNIEDGPSGLAYYPGTGLGKEYTGSFFLCHFKGSPANSGIQTYTLKPKGAGFEVVDSRTFLRGALPTDVTFGPDSRLYFSDWVSGWPKSRRGRIYAIEPVNPDASERAAASETRKLIREGMNDRAAAELIGLLGHSDQRVRLAAQFELAERGRDSLTVLEALSANTGAPRLARIHALWGMGQLATTVPAALNSAPRLLEDPDSEIRAQAAKLIGDHLRIESFRFLIDALQDSEPRVAFFAAQSLGKLKRKQAIPPLIELLRRNDDQDATLRHAIVIALSRLGPDPALARTVNDPSRAVKLGGLLAYRRLGDTTAGSFLEDFDPYIVREAALAINDTPIEAALPALAALLETAPLDDEPLILRAINAHFRLGRSENARALADFAGRPYVPAPLRAEALNQLALWATPPDRDRLTGLYQPLPPRETEPAKEALGSFLSHIAGKAPEQVQIATINAVTALAISGIGHALWDVVFQEGHPVAARIAALQALEKLNDLRLEVAAQTAGRSLNPGLRMAALPILARLNPAVSLPALKFLASDGTAAEQRAAFSILGEIEDPRADQILVQALRRLVGGDIPTSAQVELLDAASARTDPELVASLQQIQNAWQTGGDRLAPYRAALEGGDEWAGRRLFENHPVLACVRCHQTGGGADAGPSLAGIGMMRTKEELLESIVFPNAKISPGFEIVSLTLQDDRKEAGLLLQEDDSRIELRRADRTTVSVLKDRITHREANPSAMPEIYGQILSRSELRDLIAYLSDLTDPPQPAFSQPRALRRHERATGEQ